MIITEVMYDVEGSDDGHEWIEVQNNSTESIDFSKYKLFEGGVNHKIRFVSGSEKILPQNYAVIVQNNSLFLKDNPNFSGTIFDSSFSLGNTVDNFSIKDEKGNEVDTYSYNSTLGGGGNGKSLQKIDGLWVESAPTAGQINVRVSPQSAISKTLPKVTKSSPKIPEKSEKIGDAVSANIPVATVITNSISQKSFPENVTHSSPIFYILFLLVMILSAGIVFYIRKNTHRNEEEKVAENDASDFEIVD